MTNTFSVRYTLTLDDFRQFSKAYRSLTRTRAIACNADLIALAAMLALAAYSFATNDFGSVSFALTLAAILVVMRFLFRPWQVRRQFEQQRLGEYEIDLRADDEGFHVRSELSEGLQKWASVREVNDLPHHIVLWPNNRIGWIVPKRAFSTPAEAEAFAQFAKEKTAGQTL